jgi:histidinol-phosphate aminotransferase
MDRLRLFVERRRDLVYMDSGSCRYPLDKNENLLIPRELVADIMARAAREVDPRTYPGEEERLLSEEIGEMLSIDPEMVLLTNGADEAIDLLLSIAGVVGEKPRISILRPSFPMYSLRSLLRGYRVEYIDLSEDGFNVDVGDAVDKASRSDLVFLCSPNNPTGNILDVGIIRAIAEASRGVVVIDQAYIEFSEDQQDLADLVKIYDNIAIIRTLSKAFGLAGLRLGYVVASDTIIKALRIARLPFQINKFSLRVGLEAVRMREELLKYTAIVRRNREILYSRLKEIGYLEPFRTHTNFVIARAGVDVGYLDSFLRGRGFCVRCYRDLFRRGDSFIRITVASEEIIDLLVKTLGDLDNG